MKQLYKKGLRKCYKCKEIKKISEFGKNKNKSTGYGYLCRKCDFNKHSDGTIFPYDFDYDSVISKLIKDNGNVCFICNKKSEKLCLDHNHKTGKIRGLLCSKCNYGLGLFQDNIDFLKNSIKYLEKYD